MPDKPANDNGDAPLEDEYPEPTFGEMQEVVDFMRKAGLSDGGSLEELVNALKAHSAPPALH